MANDKSGGKKLLTTVITIILVIIGSVFGINVFDILETDDADVQEKELSTIVQVEAPENVEGVLTLTMIDVGQADCFLFEQNGMTALVDCGTRHDGDDVLKFLEEKGITKLGYLFGSHPHDDHMGGMQEIIMNIEIGKIIIPDVEESKATSEWYTLLLKEILKAGHHGSYTSSSVEFLDSISPDYVLISVGLGNKHDHPIKSTMEKYEEREIEVYRTDEEKEYRMIEVSLEAFPADEEEFYEGDIVVVEHDMERVIRILYKDEVEKRRRIEEISSLKKLLEAKM